MLRQLAPDLWVTERPLRFFGLEVGTRMTVMRLSDGGLLLHSPVALDDPLRQALDALGPARFAVAPNRFHHLYVGQYPPAYPELRIYVAPGLERKRPDLAIGGVLGDEAPAAWAGQVDQLVFRGFPLANEVVFLHRGSRTLVLSDLCFNMGPERPLATRVALRLIGGYGRFGPSHLERVAIRNRAAARACLSRILAWDFERVIVAHGAVLESGGPAALREGYAWLLAH